MIFLEEAMATLVNAIINSRLHHPSHVLEPDFFKCHICILDGAALRVIEEWKLSKI